MGVRQRLVVRRRSASGLSAPCLCTDHRLAADRPPGRAPFVRTEGALGTCGVRRLPPRDDAVRDHFCSAAAARAGPTTDVWSCWATSMWSAVQIILIAVLVPCPPPSERSRRIALISRSSAVSSRAGRSGTLPYPDSARAASWYHLQTCSPDRTISARAVVWSPVGRVVVLFPEVDDGVRGQSQHGDRFHQRRRLRQRNVLGAPFGEETTEGVVEPPGRRRGVTPLVLRRGGGRHAPVGPGHPVLDGTAQRTTRRSTAKSPRTQSTSARSRSASKEQDRASRAAAARARAPATAW